jgi:hypothetical protein
MLIIFILGAGLLEVSQMDFFMSHNQADGVKAYYIAEAGMNKGMPLYAMTRMFSSKCQIN